VHYKTPGGRGVVGYAKIQMTQFFVKQKVKTNEMK
jgi:hypothetical protein